MPSDLQWGQPMTQVGQPGNDAGTPPQGPVAQAAGDTTKEQAPAAPSSAAPLSPAVQKAAKTLAQAVKGQRKAWDRMAYMCDQFGPRPLGSKGLQDATQWAVKTLQMDGASSAREETVMLKPWQRGSESAQLVEPVERDLHVVGLGLSVPTPRRGIQAEIEVVQNFDEIAALGAQGRLKDKIVVVNGVMPAYDPKTNEPYYGDTVRYRTQSASLAAKQGAKAVLIRSITADSLQTPHTGVLWYESDAPKIPAAALSIEDVELLQRLRKRGPVKVKLQLSSKLAKKEVKSANVLAELKGREKPEEIVLIGAHIDSWDNGPGAQDDAAGVAMVLEAMRMLRAGGLVPKRTIRAVLFTDEESGLRGAHAYMKAHENEPHIAAIEADMGAGAPRSLGLGAPEAVRKRIASYLPLFEPLGVRSFSPTGGGADISLLMKKGVLGISIEPEMGDYFAIHHTAADTPEKVDPQHLQSHAGSMALMAFLLAEEDLNLTASAVAPAGTDPSSAKPASPKAASAQPTATKPEAAKAAAADAKNTSSTKGTKP